MIDAYEPNAEYVERLATRADEALASVGDVWPEGIPVEVRDDAGLFHPARHVAYCARATEPDDDEMSLFKALIAGLPQRYNLPPWRAERTIENIVEWVRDPQNARYVWGKAAAPGRHEHRVLGCARHVVRVAASGMLHSRGETNGEIAERLGCSERHVRTLLAEAKVPAKKRPRWDQNEINALEKAVEGRENDSVRGACAKFGKKNGRSTDAALQQWKRIKRKRAEAARHT